MNKISLEPRGAPPPLAGDVAWLPSERRLTIDELRSILIRNLTLIGMATGIALTIGAAAAFLVEPRYVAEATVSVLEHSVSNIGNDPGDQAHKDDKFLQEQLALVRSRFLAEAVAADLDLANNRAFLDPHRGQAGPAVLLAALQENLDVDLPEKSGTLRIRFSSKDPMLSASIANGYAENLIERQVANASEVAQRLNLKTEAAAERLQASELAVAAFAKRNRLIDMSENPKSGNVRTPVAGTLQGINDAHAIAMSRRIEWQQRWSQAQAGSVRTMPELLENPAAQQLLAERAQQTALLVQELRRRREEHPAVAQAAARIGELDRQIDALGASIRNGLHQQYRRAAQQEIELRAELEKLKDEALEEQERSIHYQSLKRQAYLDRQLYEQLMTRQQQLSAHTKSDGSNMYILDRAQPPLEPTSPSRAAGISLAGLTGLALSFLLIFVRERFSDAIHLPEDAEAALQIDPIIPIPRVEPPSSPIEALAEPRSTISEAFHQVRISLAPYTSKSRNIVAVVSSGSGEGRSISAYGLARSYARNRAKTLLVEADLRNPSLRASLAVEPDAGLGNILAGGADFTHAVCRAISPNLDFLSAGDLQTNPSDLLASTRLRSVLESIRDRYDYIVLDTPPAERLPDAHLITAAVDIALFVMEAGRTKQSGSSVTLRRLKCQAHFVAGVLMKTDLGRRSNQSRF